MSDLIGGRYRKVKCLSSNEEDRLLTFIVEDLQIPGRKYVAKVYADIENQNQQQKFREIIEILSNPVFEQNIGVTKLRDAGEDRYLRYLIFDYAKGETLEQKIEQDIKFSSDEVERLVNEILFILKPIHEAGFIHGDIKPSNIIINSQEQKVILIDFDAISKINQDNQVENKGNAVIAFTSGYAPLEQESGCFSPQNDLYALGMTAIKALTGQSPQTFKRQPNGEIILPSNLAFGYRLERVLIAITHESSMQRYFSCSEVLEDLCRTGRTQRVVPPIVDEENEKSNGISWYGKIALLFLIFIIVPFTWGYTTMKSLLNPIPSPPVAEKPDENNIDDISQIPPQSSTNDVPMPKTLPKKDESNVPTDEVELNTDSVFENQDLGLLFQDGRKKENSTNSKKSQNKNFNVPADEVEPNTDSVSKNQDSGLLFQDGR